MNELFYIYFHYKKNWLLATEKSVAKWPKSVAKHPYPAFQLLLIFPFYLHSIIVQNDGIYYERESNSIELIKGSQSVKQCKSDCRREESNIQF